MTSEYSAWKRLAVAFLILFLLPVSPYAASRRPFEAKHGIVTSTSVIASQVGVEVLKKGGNAVDAAVAVALALAVVWPQAGNLGGGGFLLLGLKDGETEAIDYRERAPLAASREMYQDAQGNVIPDLSMVGYKAVAVPGTIAGLAMAHKRHGTMKWEDLVEPAYRLASQGFEVNRYVTEGIQAYVDTLSKFDETRRLLLPGGMPVQPGARLVQPDLAATLARLKKNGPREFYEGKTAQMIAADMKANGGLITMQDLREYEPTLRKPLRGSYRGYDILTMPLPSSGGVVLLEMLNMLELFPVAEMGYRSADQIHLFTEVMRRGFADRAQLGDTDFVALPVSLERLTSKEYGKTLAGTIDMRKATPSSTLGPGKAAPPESASTTHFSILDAEGNVVANTYTLNDSFGSGVMAHGTGILLNNEMDDFTSKPGVPNLYGLMQGEANAIAPRKRPLSSMTPTIVLKDNRPFLVIGSPGGPTIINTVLHTVTGIIDFGMDVQQAIDAPRFHHQWMPDLIYFEPFTFNKDTRALLETRGNSFSDKPFFKDAEYFGNAQGILIDSKSGTLTAASDPRGGGQPAGY